MLVLRKSKRFTVLFAMGCLFLLPSCREVKRESVHDETQLQPIPLQHATHFRVEEAPFGYVATIFAGKTEQDVSFKYALVRDDSDNLPDDAQKIKIPITRVGTNSGTLFGFLGLLGEMEKIVATCDAKYIFSDKIRDKVQSGEIISLGSSFEMNGEHILIAHPDVLFLSDLRDNPHSNACPIVHNFEWKETSALARTEWIKFFSLFFDKYTLADSIFQSIERRYTALKQLTDTISNRPTVISAGNYGETWYMTGGEGFMSKMYEDAGGDYLLADTMVPTVTCGTEWLLTQYADADYWMNCGTTRLEELDPRLHQMKSYKSGNVYHFQKRERRVENMNISDFYESAVAQPDVVLEDLISVLHPALLPHHETIYLGRCGDNEERR